MRVDLTRIRRTRVKYKIPDVVRINVVGRSMGYEKAQMRNIEIIILYGTIGYGIKASDMGNRI